MNNPAIFVQNLSKEFESMKALNDLTLEIPPGIIFGFLGPNGAGKTTTIRLLLGLLEPTSGSAEVLGFDTRTQADHIRAHAGALLEHTGIYEQMSAEDNLEFYGRAFGMPVNDRDARVQELLVRMQLWDRRRDRAGSWSRGMKQKLALARALLHRPKLILLDEPTAGLDVQSAVEIREDLEALVSEEEVTIFLTTHNMTDAERLCDRVAIIKSGALLTEGRPEELRSGVGVSRLEIIGEGINDQVLGILRTLPPVTAVQSHNNHVVVEVDKGTQSADLVSTLVNCGVQIEEVRRSTVSLEEVFLKYTGEEND